MIEVVEVSPFDRAAFADWHAALAAGTEAGRTAAIVSTLKELTDSLAVPSEVKRRAAYAALRDDECVGGMVVGTPLKNDVTTMELELAVPPAHRRTGVGAALWDRAVTHAAEAGRTVFHVDINVPLGQTLETWPGAIFAAKRGFESVHVEDHLIADLPFDQERLAAIEARHRDEGYRVEAFVGRCPDRFLAAWADLQTAMSMDLPTGDLIRDKIVYTPEQIRAADERVEKNWIALSTLAIAPDDEPVGYSIIYLPRTQPQHALQDDTLVLRAHRGHDLGALLKTENLRQLERMPAGDLAERRWLHTYTAQSNAPMQRVNERFGFRAIEVMHEFELTRSALN